MTNHHSEWMIVPAFHLLIGWPSLTSQWERLEASFLFFFFCMCIAPCVHMHADMVIGHSFPHRSNVSNTTSPQKEFPRLYCKARGRRQWARIVQKEDLVTSKTLRGFVDKTKARMAPGSVQFHIRVGYRSTDDQLKNCWHKWRKKPDRNCKTHVFQTLPTCFANSLHIWIASYSPCVTQSMIWRLKFWYPHLAMSV